MKMQLCLNGTRQEILAQIDEARLVFATSIEAQPPAGAARAGKPAKDKKEEKEPEVEAEEPTPAEASEGGDDMGFDEPPPAKEKKKELKIEDVQIAFRDFAKAKEGNREKAKKVLEKFKVKSVLDLKKEDFEKAIAALK
jgi:hypothetical protein